MAPAVILLTDWANAFFLAALLRACNPALAITTVTAADELEKTVAAAPAGTRLIAYGTGIVVGARQLERLGAPAYNFHPGPPEYPGKHPIAFALYDGAAEYGVTVHEMVARTDSGPIVAVGRFPVAPGIDAHGLRVGAYELMARMFVALAPRLADPSTALPVTGLEWGSRRCSQRALDALCAIPPDIDAAELARRERAFGWLEPNPLRLTLHGRRFAPG